jgi:hypothetical protein
MKSTSHLKLFRELHFNTILTSVTIDVTFPLGFETSVSLIRVFWLTTQFQPP